MRRKYGIEGYIEAETFTELSYVMIQKVIHNKNKKRILNKLGTQLIFFMIYFRNRKFTGYADLNSKENYIVK